VNLEFVAPLEERDEVVPNQQHTGYQQQKQCIGVGLLELGVVGRRDQLRNPALDEDPDVLQDVADRRSSGGQVVDRRTGACYPTDRQDGAEKSQPPTGSGYECTEQVGRLRELVLGSSQRLGHAPDADADRRDERQPLER
jgi:hypothetical protein